MTTIPNGNGHTTPTPPDVIKHNSLLALQQTVKSLCSKTLPASRRRLEQLAPDMFRHVAALYFRTVDEFAGAVGSWIDGGGNRSGRQGGDFAGHDPVETGLAQRLATAVLCVKIQRWLIVHAITGFHKVAETAEFFGRVLDHLDLIELRRRIPPTSPVSKHLTSLLLSIGKFYLDLEKHHLVQFVLCPRSTAVLSWYWSKIAGSSSNAAAGGVEVGAGAVDSAGYPDASYERFLVQGLMMIKNVVKNPDLSPPLNFDAWFRNTLAAEVQVHGGPWKLIRRRIAWLTGCWVPVKASKELRPLVYNVLVSLLRSDEDMVVRLTAVQNLRLVVDDWDFDAEGFTPFLEGIVDMFVELLAAVEEFDTKLRILNCLAVIIERMETKILPFAHRVVEVLPTLWAESESQNMFRCSMLVILTKLVTSSREQSLGLQPFILPLVRHSVDIDEPQHVYLLEEGLELWLATVQNSPSCDANLMALVPLALRLLELSSESLNKTFKILETYAVLDPTNFLTQFSTPVSTSLATQIMDLKPKAANMIVATIDSVLQAAWAASLLPQVLEVMLQSTLLDKLVQLVVVGEEDNWILAGYLSLLARIAVYDTSLFLNLCSLVGSRCVPPQSIILPLIVSAMVDKMDAVGHPKRRQLFAMALAGVIPTRDEAVLSQLGGVFGVLTQVLVEVREAAGDSVVFWTEPREDFEDEESLDHHRRHALMSRDPVYTTPLPQFVRAKLAECESMNGGAEEFSKNVLAKLDPTIVRLLQENLR
ncbi:Importin-11 [Gonapodya sp. JEL0774]|nr:Importin-11 [Gonapodya sp. JEL0774]